MKKILHLLASRIYSGAENVVCTIIENFKEEYDMLYCSPNGPIQGIVEKKQIKYYGIDELNLKNIKKVIKEYNPDIIHAHDYTASVLAALSGFKGKIVSHIHNNCSFAKTWNLKTIAYAVTTNKYSKVIGVSDSVYAEAVYNKRIKDKYITIPNYVNIKKIKEKSEEYEFNKEYDTFFIGRLVEEKNPIEYIEIIKKLKEEYKFIKAVMIGDGNLYGTCKEMIDKYNLQDNIDMLGFIENPFPIINKCKIGIMPSKWEGFGLTAIEAMALNKPVLNSGVGGLSKIFSNNQELICSNIIEYVRKYKKLINNSNFIEANIVNVIEDENEWKKKINEIYMG